MIDRIAVLGGSSVYTPEFVLSLISHNLNVKEITLLGRPGKKLGIVTQFCQRLLNKSGFPARIIGTTNVVEAVAGAKYILNQIRVGGLRARLRDEKLPPKQGMIGDEALGAGGFANAMRTLPVLMDYAQKIEQTNPDAVVINLTNPMGIVVEALTRYSKLNVIGVCDLPHKYIKKIAEVLHKTPNDVHIDYIGLNNMGWIQDVRVNGHSYMGLVLERLERHNQDEFDFDLIELFRMIPTRSMSIYFHTDQILKKQQTTNRYRAEILQEAEKQILKMYEDEHLCEIPDLARERNALWYDEIIVPLIDALECHKERDIILCVKNNGAIRDLSDDSTVEIPVRVCCKGLTPHMVGSCPHFLRGLFHAVKESDRLSVEAAYHRSYEYALQALTINPFVPSFEVAKKFLDRIVKDEKIELH